MLSKLKLFINSRINIFSSEKVLDNKLFNFFGLQIFRILINNFIIFLKRKIFFSNGYYASTITKVNEIKEKGFLIFNEFLNNEEFEKLQNYFNQKIEKEVLSIPDKYEKRFSISSKVFNKENIKDIKNPWYKIIFEKKELGKIIEVLMTKKLSNMKNSFIHYEKLYQNRKKLDLPNDPQNIYHRDTFYCSLKFIYLMNDVSTENGPFSYIEGTNKITYWKIKKEYLGSIKFKKNLRDENLVFEKEKTKVFCQKKNTLILFDTSGFHKRLPTKIDNKRETIRFGSREHPFSFLI